MIYFNSDYVEGAHPLILNKLIETNFCQTVGYGEDEYCENARNLIKKACKRDEGNFSAVPLCLANVRPLVS